MTKGDCSQRTNTCPRGVALRGEPFIDSINEHLITKLTLSLSPSLPRSLSLSRGSTGVNNLCLVLSFPGQDLPRIRPGVAGIKESGIRGRWSGFKFYPTQLLCDEVINVTSLTEALTSVINCHQESLRG